MTYLLYLVPLFAGALNTVQVGQNNALGKALGQPILAAFAVMLANVVVYLLAIPFVGAAWPGADKVSGVPLWAWFGGVFGGLYVLSMLFVADRVGAAIFTGLSVTAAIATSMTLDHFGLVGFPVHPAGLGRLAGAGLMVGGLVLVCVF